VTMTISASADPVVDNAEHEPELALQIHVDGFRNLAGIILKQGVKRIHLSTDDILR